MKVSRIVLLGLGWTLAVGLITACSADQPDAAPVADKDTVATTLPDSVAPTTAPSTAASSTSAPADPTPTSTTDPGPDPDEVLLAGDDWAMTRAEAAEVLAAITALHGVDVLGPVEPLQETDVAARVGFFEFLDEPTWEILDHLGMARSADRATANSIRAERVRGLCCEANAGVDYVVIEAEARRETTEVILAHEFVHAIHLNNPGLWNDAAFSGDELVAPGLALFEGIPQYLALEYMVQQGPEFAARATELLPIFTDEQLDLIGPTAAVMTMPYDLGAQFAAAVGERTQDAPGEVSVGLMSDPPLTTYELLFPDAFLAGFEAVEVPAPGIPDDHSMVQSGTIGAAVWAAALAEGSGYLDDADVVASWRGDSYVLSELDGSNDGGADPSSCLWVVIAVDPADGSTLATALAQLLPEAKLTSSPDLIELATC